MNLTPIWWENPFLNLGLSLISVLLSLEKFCSACLDRFPALVCFLFLLSYTWWTWTISLERSMLSCIIYSLHSSSISSAIPIKNLLIYSLLLRHKSSGMPWEFHKIQGILPDCHRSLFKVDKILNLGLPHLPGKNISRKVVLNNSQVIRILHKSWLSCYILHQVCATSLTW